MIDIDFNKAYAQAQVMAQCAEGIRQQQQKLNSLIEGIRKAWHGQTAEAYIKKLEAFSDKLQTEAKKCAETATAFHLRLNSIKAAEEAVQSAINTAFSRNSQ